MWRSLVIHSCLAACLTAGYGAQRPRYGGELRLQTLSPLKADQFTGEPLVASDGNGGYVPRLAVSFERSSNRSRWTFRLRPGVRFHDGSLLTPVLAAECLAELGAEASGDTVSVEAGLDRVSATRLVRPGTKTGTGPFVWSGPSTLSAFDRYWGGRPFLDTIELSTHSGTVRPLPSGLPDVTELPLSASRRLLPEQLRIWTSNPSVLLALDARNAPADVRQALSLAIDRTAIVNVILQRRGDPAYSYLPEARSGYAFLFQRPTGADEAKSKLTGRTLPPLSIGFDARDPLARTIAERIAVNARDAGLLLQVKPEGTDLRVVFVPAQLPNDPVAPQQRFDLERSLLANGPLIPIAHAPEIFGLHPRVRNWNGLDGIADVWLAP